jgi:hypothetical protein
MLWWLSYRYREVRTGTDRVVTSIDGFNSYLLVVDKFSRYMWIFLCKSKEPPIDDTFGLQEGGVIRCDQGGELAGSEEFITSMLKHHNYGDLPVPAGAVVGRIPDLIHKLLHRPSPHPTLLTHTLTRAP